jgi:hypothetical protein
MFRWGLSIVVAMSLQKNLRALASGDDETADGVAAPQGYDGAIRLAVRLAARAG